MDAEGRETQEQLPRGLGEGGAKIAIIPYSLNPKKWEKHKIL